MDLWCQGLPPSQLPYDVSIFLKFKFSPKLINESAKDIGNQRFTCTQAKADNAAKVKAKKCNKMKLDLNTIQVGFKRREDFNQ